MSKRRILATTFRAAEVRAVVSLLRKLRLGAPATQLAPVANSADVVSVHAKFLKMLAKSEAP